MAIMMPPMNTVMNGLMLAVYRIGAYLIGPPSLRQALPCSQHEQSCSQLYSGTGDYELLLMSMVFVLWPRADVSAQRVMEG